MITPHDPAVARIAAAVYALIIALGAVLVTGYQAVRASRRYAKSLKNYVKLLEDARKTSDKLIGSQKELLRQMDALLVTANVPGYLALYPTKSEELN